MSGASSATPVVFQWACAYADAWCITNANWQIIDAYISQYNNWKTDSFTNTKLKDDENPRVRFTHSLYFKIKANHFSLPPPPLHTQVHNITSSLIFIAKICFLIFVGGKHPKKYTSYSSLFLAHLGPTFCSIMNQKYNSWTRLDGTPVMTWIEIKIDAIYRTNSWPTYIVNWFRHHVHRRTIDKVGHRRQEVWTLINTISPILPWLLLPSLQTLILG